MPQTDQPASTCAHASSASASERKASLRATLRQARRDLAPQARAELSTCIVDNLLLWLDRQTPSPRVVSIYLASPSEANIDAMIEPLRARGIGVGAPRHSGFARIEAASTCSVGAGQSWRQADGADVPVEEIEVALLPGVAFGRDGSRLGQGQAWFDRVLVGSRAILVGVCFGCQIVDALPVEAHDRFVSWIACEDGVAPAL